MESAKVTPEGGVQPMGGGREVLLLLLPQPPEACRPELYGPQASSVEFTGGAGNPSRFLSLRAQ